MTDQSAPSPWRWWVCILLLLATTLNYLDRVALNQTASDIKAAFRLNNTEYSRLESSFQLAFAVGAIVTGVLVDWLGVRIMYPIAVIGWSIAGFLTGYANTYLILLICRIGLGIFEAGNWPCGIRTIRQVMPAQERSLGSAIFQSGTGLGAMITPVIVLACYAWADPFASTRMAHQAVGSGLAGEAVGHAPEVWQIPFRIIGIIGIGWVLLWLFTVPSRVLQANDTSTAAAPPAPFWSIFENRKFWILIFVVIGVNTTWHTFRVWLPLFLKEQLDYSAVEMSRFTFLYYAVADIGSWLVGLSVLLLTRAGMELHRSRMIVFAIGVLIVLTAVGIPFWRELGPKLTVILILITGFGALGLFAAYFALSQEVSGRHQGKVTGLLGAINSIYLAGVYEVQGRVADYLGGYDRVLAVAGLPALLALIIVWLCWPRTAAEASSK
jgi:MFS transporter, ACS family, hexuronate transporter